MREDCFTYWERLGKEEGWQYEMASIGATALFAALVIGVSVKILRET